MSGKTASLIGVTGMIGTYLLEDLLQDTYFTTIKLLVRRPFEKTDPRIEVKLVDFDDAESFKLALEGSDVIFCCIGTTQKNVKGDEALYRRIDFDIPARAARFGKEAGAHSFVTITSVGATPKSRTFYLRLKGEVESALQASDIHTVHIMQPSMLLGKRKEKRSGEKIFQVMMKSLSWLFMGSLRKYKAIPGKTVAKAMLNAAKKEEPGFFRYTYDGIRKLAGR